MVAGILAALYERERSGRGQAVETSLLEAAAALAAHRLIRDGSGEPIFNRFVGACYRPYPADGAIALACYAPSMHLLFAALGLDELADDERFATLPARARHSDELAGLLGARLASETTATWRERLSAAGLPHGRVSDRPLSLLDHPDAREIGLVEVEDPTLGPELVTGPPMRFSRTPARTVRPRTAAGRAHARCSTRSAPRWPAQLEPELGDRHRRPRGGVGRRVDLGDAVDEDGADGRRRRGRGGGLAEGERDVAPALPREQVGVRVHAVATLRVHLEVQVGRRGDRPARCSRRSRSPGRHAPGRRTPTPARRPRGA